MDDKKQNQGEGNKTADKNYRDAATEFAKRTDTLQAGLQAGREVEQQPDEFAKAEQDAKSHSAGDLLEDLSGRGFNKNLKK